MSWWDRRRGRHVCGRWRAVRSATGLTLGAGYLGGALVYGSGIGVDRSGPGSSVERLDDRTLPAGRLLDGRPERVEVDGVGVVLYRDGSDVHWRVGEHCPHLGAPMADGWIDRGRIVCPWHGSRFAMCVGCRAAWTGHRALPRYPTRVRDGFGRGSRSEAPIEPTQMDGGNECLRRAVRAPRCAARALQEDQCDAAAVTDERRDASSMSCWWSSTSTCASRTTCSIRRVSGQHTRGHRARRASAGLGPARPSSAHPAAGCGLRRRVARLRHRSGCPRQ